MASAERRLAAIMFTDLVGYSARVQADEASALALLEKHFAIVRPLLTMHGGREVKTIGDAFLVEFQSALSAVQCALAIQQAHVGHNVVVPAADRVFVKVGIHLGDVEVRDGDLFGDGVNIAARLEPTAPPGGIVISRQVHDQVVNKLGIHFVARGPTPLKNIATPIETFVFNTVDEPTPKVQLGAPATASLFDELGRRRVFKAAGRYAIVAWVMVQAASTLAPALRLPEWSLPFVVYMLALGFPVVLLLSWTFDFTPSGIALTPSVAAQSPRRRLLALGAMALLATLGLFLALRATVLDFNTEARAMPAAGGTATIAVQPFTDLSPQGPQRWLTEALMDEVARALTETRRVRVLRGAGGEHAQSGQGEADQLVVDGNLRPVGDSMRITVRLSEGREGYLVASNTYSVKSAALRDDSEAIAKLAQQVVADMAPHLPADNALANPRSAALAVD